MCYVNNCQIGLITPVIQLLTYSILLFLVYVADLQILESTRNLSRVGNVNKN